MATRLLTELVLQNARLPATGQYVIWDKNLSGFGVRISQGGTRSFIVMFYEGKRKRRRTIGKYPAISLSEARAEAKKVMAGAALGITQETRQKTSIHFAESIELFETTHCARHNKPSTAKETMRLLRTNFLPHLKNMQLPDITTFQVADIIDSYHDRPSLANHAFAAIRKFFNWAKERRHIERSPCEGMRLPSRPVARERVLDENEVVQVYRAASEFGYPYGQLVMLLLLTGQRRQEITNLQWEFIDEEKGVITIPAEFNKSNRQHTVSLAPKAKQIIYDLPGLSETFLFPARGNSDRTFSGFSKSKRRFDKLCYIKEPWTLHDLRRTMATHMAGIPIPLNTADDDYLCMRRRYLICAKTTMMSFGLRFPRRSLNLRSVFQMRRRAANIG